MSLVETWRNLRNFSVPFESAYILSGWPAYMASRLSPIIWSTILLPWPSTHCSENRYPLTKSVGTNLQIIAMIELQWCGFKIWHNASSQRNERHINLPHCERWVKHMSFTLSQFTRHRNESANLYQSLDNNGRFAVGWNDRHGSSHWYQIACLSFFNYLDACIRICWTTAFHTGLILRVCTYPPTTSCHGFVVAINISIKLSVGRNTKLNCVV